MKEKITPYIKAQLDSRPLQLQYIVNHDVKPPSDFVVDPLMEDENEVVKGLVHKYSNRALVKISYRCAAHCRFCTRFRQIGTNEGDLSPDDISNIAKYLEEHPEINDVILSGGDPLYTPKQTLALLDLLENIPSVKVLRIGTRLPIQSPLSLSSALIQKTIDKLDLINKKIPVVILLNIEHPDELTEQTTTAIRALRQRGFILLSQSVFLKGVNNDYDILFSLFQNLYHLGVVPYYIFRCDYVAGVEQFICDIEEERKIMTMLRSNLSGIACPTYAIDVPGKGKLPVPLNYWKVDDIHSCQDFEGTDILLEYL